MAIKQELLLKKVQCIGIYQSQHDHLTVGEFCQLLKDTEYDLRNNPEVSVVKVNLGKWPREGFSLTSFRYETEQERTKRITTAEKRKADKLKNKLIEAELEAAEASRKLDRLKRKQK